MLLYCCLSNSHTFSDFLCYLWCNKILIYWLFRIASIFSPLIPTISLCFMLGKKLHQLFPQHEIEGKINLLLLSSYYVYIIIRFWWYCIGRIFVKISLSSSHTFNNESRSYTGRGSFKVNDNEFLFTCIYVCLWHNVVLFFYIFSLLCKK